MPQVPGVVRVRCRTGGSLTRHIPCRNRIRGCTAGTLLRACSEWIYPTRTHIAHTAAYAKQTKTALRLLRFIPIPNSLHPFSFSSFKYFYICLIFKFFSAHLFSSFEKFSIYSGNLL